MFIRKFLIIPIFMLFSCVVFADDNKDRFYEEEGGEKYLVLGCDSQESEDVRASKFSHRINGYGNLYYSHGINREINKTGVWLICVSSDCIKDDNAKYGWVCTKKRITNIEKPIHGCYKVNNESDLNDLKKTVLEGPLKIYSNLDDFGDNPNADHSYQRTIYQDDGTYYTKILFTVAWIETLETHEIEIICADSTQKEKSEKVLALQSSIASQSEIINKVKTAHSGDKVSVWKNAAGDFNTSRLVSDSAAGVVVGSVGGLVTSSVMKKNQVKKGFEDLSCVQSGTKIANLGDDFSITGAKTKADCDKAAGNGKTNTFIWASKNNTGDDFASLVEDTKNSENNVCWARVEMNSADSRIRTDNIKVKYFIIGNTQNCGAWLDEAEIKKQILSAKKKARVGGTIAGVVGGMAVGVGAMEAFGNKAIGGNVQGQKSLSTEQLFKSQVLAEKGGEAEWKKYETAKSERDKLCKDLKAIGGTSKECE